MRGSDNDETNILDADNVNDLINPVEEKVVDVVDVVDVVENAFSKFIEFLADLGVIDVSDTICNSS